jgi:hypothetical protein
MYISVSVLGNERERMRKKVREKAVFPGGRDQIFRLLIH